MARARAAVPLAAAAGLVVGVATSFGQSVLPQDVLAPLANSAGPWVLVAALLAGSTRRPGLAAVVGPVALLAMVAGYYGTAHLRDHGVSATTVTFWCAAALVIGAPAGVASVWARERTPYRAALAAGVLAGILIGEGAHGLLRLEHSPVWWAAEVVLGCALAVAAASRRATPLHCAVPPLTAAVVGTVVWAVFGAGLLGLLGLLG